MVVGPSHDALLVGKDGVKWQIHETAAPIFNDTGSVFAGARGVQNGGAVMRLAKKAVWG